MVGDEYLTQDEAQFIVNVNESQSIGSIEPRWYGYLVSLQEKEGQKRFWQTNRKDRAYSSEGRPSAIYHGPMYERNGPLIDPPRPAMEDQLDMDLEDIHAAQDLVNGV